MGCWSMHRKLLKQENMNWLNPFQADAVDIRNSALMKLISWVAVFNLVRKRRNIGRSWMLSVSVYGTLFCGGSG